MTTTNNSINISPTNVKGRCNLKCSYSFNYNNSNVTATNLGMSIKLNYDKPSVPPVTYNGQKYFVKNVYIFSPSLHNYMDRRVNAELLIQHVSELGQPFAVCVPIIAGTNMNVSSGFLTEIIRNVANSAPSEGQEVTINLPNFTLQPFIPVSKPFFSYVNTTKGAFSGNYIVFGLVSAISLTQNTLNRLSRIIRPFSIVMTGNDLFVNIKGARSGEFGDGIYISCQPTGNSQEKINIFNEKSEITAISLDNPIFTYLFQILVSCIIFIILFAVINLIYKNLFVSNVENNSNE